MVWSKVLPKILTLSSSFYCTDRHVSLAAHLVSSFKDSGRCGLPGWRIVSEVGAVDRVDQTEVAHVTHEEMNQQHVLHQQAFLLQLSCNYTKSCCSHLIRKVCGWTSKNPLLSPQAQTGINARHKHAPLETRLSRQAQNGGAGAPLHPIRISHGVKFVFPSQAFAFQRTSLAQESHSLNINLFNIVSALWRLFGEVRRKTLNMLFISGRSCLRLFSLLFKSSAGDRNSQSGGFVLRL